VHVVKNENMLYFQAVAQPAAGKLDIKVVDDSLYQARRDTNREERVGAARHFERFFHIWNVFSASTDELAQLEYKELILPALEEYIAVLKQLEPDHRFSLLEASSSLSDNRNEKCKQVKGDGRPINIADTEK
jgi:hypothetical protein